MHQFLHFFFFFQLFSSKTVRKAYFEQHLECPVPKCWSRNAANKASLHGLLTSKKIYQSCYWKRLVSHLSAHVCPFKKSVFFDGPKSKATFSMSDEQMIVQGMKRTSTQLILIKRKHDWYYINFRGFSGKN